MPSTSTLRIRRAIGLIMLALGSLLLSRMYVFNLPPKIGSPLLNTAIGIAMILRGGLYLYMTRKRNPEAEPLPMKDELKDQG